MTSPSPLASQIDEARRQGYGDDEIMGHLAQSHADLAPKIKEAQDNGYSSSDVLSHLSSSAPPKQPSVLETAYERSGIPGLVEMGKGAVKGMTRTATNLGLFGEAAKTKPSWQKALEPDGGPQQLGYTAEGIGEYAAPGGLVEKGTAAIASKAATKLAPKAASAATALGRAILEATSAGTVAGVQSGGDPNAIKTAAATAGLTSGVMSGIKAALPSGEKVAKRLYQSALKPAPSMEQAEREAILKTGLREGIILDPNVVDNVQGRIEALNKQIGDEIATRSQNGAVVDPTAVAKYTDRSKNTFTSQATPEADLAAVQSAKNEFLRTNSKAAPYTKIRPGTAEAEGTFVPEGEGVNQVPQDIPLADAQRMKQGTYRKLRDSYGEQSTATRETLKDIARGLKDKIVEAFPEISGLNAREGSLLGLEASLQRFVGREGNKQLIGLGTPMTATALHAAGSPVVIPTMLKAWLESPEAKSKLAIALYKASQGNPGAVMKTAQTLAPQVPRAAAYGVTPRGQQVTMPPPGQ